MFVLIAYDVNITSPKGAKRLRDVAKTCLNYGKRVQNSVFECIVNEAQYVKLKDTLSQVINPEEDSIRFYLLGANWKRKVETVGKEYVLEFEDDLII